VAIKKIVETQQKEIAFLVNVDPTFVSLVRHGANQQPFRVVKSEEKGGVDEMSMVVQSILLPQNVTLEELQAKGELAWLAEAKSDEVIKHGEYTKLIQLKEEKFDRSSLNLVKLDSSGAYALAGQLVDKTGSDKVLTLGRTEVDKVPQIRQSPMDSVIAEEARPAFVLTFRDMFEKELSSFLDVVRGALSQSEAANKQRKKMVMDALGAFQSFLSIGIDALGTEGAKIEKLEQTLKKQDHGGNDMFQFESEKDFTDKVTSIVTEAVETAVKEVAKQPATKKEAELPNAKAEKDAENAEEKGGTKLSEVLEKIDALGAGLKGLTEKHEKLESQLVTDPAGGQSDDDIVKKNEELEKEKPGVFAGLLVRPAPTKQDQAAV